MQKQVFMKQSIIFPDLQHPRLRQLRLPLLRRRDHADRPLLVQPRQGEQEQHQLGAGQLPEQGQGQRRRGGAGKRTKSN